jgi:hypothetical protein
MFLFLFVTLLTGHLVFAGQEGMITSCNPRFGFCVDYPKHFTAGPEPVNSDGRRFYDAEGFVIIAAGANNALDYTLEQENEIRKS